MSSANGSSTGNWVPVLLISEKPGTWLGVAAREWRVASSAAGPGEPLSERAWVPAWPLLERDLVTVANELQEAQVITELPVFPFDQLVASGMRSSMDYWASLALDWAEAMEANEVIAEAAGELRQASWASQRTRQRARRVVKSFEGGST